ncbi:uncharacterized protein [Euwallacea fornicatus]|uniref:uncharacterized protein n=1 Tax=Euwallacea fornicatus TaxID=995702 RepID=UPI00338EFF9E
MKSEDEEATLSKRNIIRNLRQEGKSYLVIANMVKKSHFIARSVKKRFEYENNFLNKAQIGRSRKLPARKDGKPIRKIQLNPRTSISEIAATKLREEDNKNISSNAVRRVLHRTGYKARAARNKLYVSKINKNNCLYFTKKHIDRNNDFSDKELFFDESKFNIFRFGVRCAFAQDLANNWNSKTFIRPLNIQMIAS